MRVFHVPSIRAYGRPKERLDHLAADQNGMSVDTLVFRNDRPNAVYTRMKSVDQRGKGFRLERRTVDQGDHCTVAAAVQDFLQSHLERAELPPFRIGIYDEISSAAVHDRTKTFGIRASNDQDKVTWIGQSTNGRGKQGAMRPEDGRIGFGPRE